MAAGGLCEGGVVCSCHCCPSVPNRKTWFGLLVICALCEKDLCVIRCISKIYELLVEWKAGRGIPTIEWEQNTGE